MEPHAYAFGQFQIDVASRQLLRDGLQVPLAATAFDALLLLVRRRDRTVTNAELMKAAGADTLASDDGAAQIVAVLRRALGDTEVIATIPRRGYRFVLPVTENPQPDWEDLRKTGVPGPGTEHRARIPDPEPRPPDSRSPIPDPQSRRRWMIVLALVIAAFLIGVLVGRSFANESSFLSR
jgi:DNA-binding winged helix-turn-helix (wHTH) protein